MSLWAFAAVGYLGMSLWLVAHGVARVPVRSRLRLVIRMARHRWARALVVRIVRRRVRRHIHRVAASSTVVRRVAGTAS